MPKHTLSLDINLTNACNFRCKYCFESGKHAPGGLQDVDTLLARLDAMLKSPEYARDFGRTHLSFWGGEPTLNFEALVGISNHFKADPSVRLMLYTNGKEYSRTHEFISGVCREHPGKFGVQMSYDGQPLHDEMRLDAQGGPTAGRVLESIALAASGGYDFSLKATIALGQLGRIHLAYEDFLEVVERHGLRNAQYFPTLDSCQSNVNCEDATFLDAMNGFKESMLILSSKEYARYKKTGTFFFKWFNDNSRLLCTAGSSLFTIDTDLCVYRCHGNLYIDEALKKKAVITTMRDPDWYGKVMKVRDEHLPMQKYEPEVCLACPATFCTRCNAFRYVHSSKSTFLDRWYDYGCQPSICRVFNIVGDFKRGLNLALGR